MEISEVEHGGKINISKVDFVCDMLDDSIPKPLFQNDNSFLILSAPPRSGKSTCIINCLCKHGKVYNRKFDKVYVVSPSLNLTAKDNPFESLPPKQIENELTVDFLDRFVNEVSESGEKVLLLLDDVVNDIRKNKGVDKTLAKTHVQSQTYHSRWWR
eukprot:SAG11_NODE_1435_length_4914_cov_10.282866_8_plen_157_part_00